MLLQLNEEQILAGSDASSIKSGKDLATAKKWVTSAHDDRTIWGECQGSGKLPYQAIIDTQNLAYKCNCPSRKFPCKHGLGLALLYVRDNTLFKEAVAPTWVSDWISKREATQQKKVEKAVEIENDPEKAEKAIKTAAKTVEKRTNNVVSGIADLRLWLSDWMRSGILEAPNKGHGYWQAQAARLIDAQAPGLANIVKEIGELNFYQKDWQEQLLQRFAYLHLLCEGFGRLETLSELEQADIRSLIGFSQDLAELKKQEGIKSTWLVVGKETEIDAQTNLHIERNWVIANQTSDPTPTLPKGEGANEMPNVEVTLTPSPLGRVGVGSEVGSALETALILNFAFRGQFPADYIRLSPGQVFEGELVFFPSTTPQRALIKSKNDLKTSFFPQGVSIETAYAQHAEGFNQFTWQTRLPMLLADITLVQQDTTWAICDTENNIVALHPSFKNTWLLLTLSGGAPVTLFGIREHETFLPLSVFAPDASQKLILYAL
ncbi:MAG: hypothetical protein RLZZ292_1699 [Bacteroidota bacterium]|jgi:hypothetical protein